MKVNFKSILLLILIVTAVIVGVSVINDAFGDSDKFEYSDVIELFDQDLVVRYEMDGDLNLTLWTLVPKLDEAGNHILSPSGG